MVRTLSGWKRKRYKWGIGILILFFLMLNVMAIFHAYHFSHFSNRTIVKTNAPEKLSLPDKLNAFLFGVNIPRPINNHTPSQPFKTIRIKSYKILECWHIIDPVNKKGTVVLFHGYCGSKSKMLDKSDQFLSMGFNTLLVDFMGSGGSEGNQTTIGYQEAEEVESVYSYLLKTGERNVYLFGTSMGAVAIMKALSEYDIHPRGIILECPFGSLYETTCARFKSMRTPSFPMAGLLVFWGGMQNGYWAFGHNPIQYAKRIECPVLLLYGENDKNVSRTEINRIYENLQGTKMLRTYPNTGHENYLLKNKAQWNDDVGKFLQELKPG